MLKNLDDIHDLIPKLSAVIKDSEKNLETALAMTIKPPKILQERGVSPIKEFSKSSSNKQDTESQNPSNIENQMNAQKQEECHDVVGEIKPIEMLSDKQDETPTPFIGNLLANIENIKESKCLLDEFQNELSQIKKDIQECAICTSRLKESQTSDNIEKNYCDKHDIYVPLLKMEGISSRSEQIQLINTLRTEISLKKELEYQLQNISRLEKELSRVKTTQNEDEVKTVETTLEFTRSYFNNLLVKQETERLLNEQQKLLKKQCDHSCDDSIKCDKCAVEKQIHELIGKIRMCISKDLKDASQRLKVQKMPSINIRKPLQLQNTLLLNIPPSFASHELSQKNIACETVIISDDNNTKRETETQVSTNKSRNIEIHPENNLYEHQRKEKTTKHKRKSSGSLAQNPLCSKEKCDRYRVVSEMNEKQIAKNNENRMPFNNFETEICSDIYDKTPSQLGFNRTIATQCDSTVSLGDNFSILTIEEVEKQRTAATQTVVCDDDSIYLFGFREYLLKRSPELALVPRVDDNKVDVELQVSMTESLESSLESKSLGVDAKSNVRKASVTILTPTKLSDYLKGEDDNISQLPSKEDDHSTQKYSFTKRVRKLERTPSIKKMFLLPAVPVQTSEASTNQPISAIELAIINPYIEPKYKMKRYSISNQDSDATNEAKGDVFYKSLISKEELPERKTLNQIESHTQEKHSVEELSEALRSINLETSAFEDQSLLNKTVIENINDQTKKINITPTENERIQEDYVKPENKNVTDDYEKKTFVNKLESIIPKEPYDSSQERNKIGEDENIRSQDAAIHSNIENGENKSRKNEKPDDSHDEKKHENSHIKYETTISADHSGIDEIRLGKKSYALEESIKEKENKNIQDSAEANENLEKNIVETQPKENEHKMKKALEEKKVSIGKSYIDDDENSGSHDTNELEEKTVYTVFPSNYQLKINTNEKFKKLLNENISMDYPVCFKSTKTFEKYKHPDDFSRDSEDTDLQSTLVEKFRNSKGKNLKNEAHHGVYYRNDTNQINRNEIQITENSKNLRSPVSNIIDERLQYSKKCAMVEDSSYSSNILSSEGEIKCKCRAVSMGELHRCPHSKKETVVKSMQPGIHYKEKISSQLLLEKERKHYNHWVTYYSTKKIANGSSSSSMDSKIDKG
ncbi:hypothetical protein HHI36_011004 [Cryptolaemus montrouzieri]|uniref:Uncharacterized protein n=1 Tax=Cryptolaemus montrouzieri TaxID=559131 RepID=A0ABD2MKJ2_9CUCU